MSGSFEERLEIVRSRIVQAASDFGRDPSSITLVCVSKTFPIDAILPALKAGQRVFGENRVQEVLTKWVGLRDSYPDLELHLIGPLQSNKVKEAVALFDVIESVDRPKIAEALAAEMKKAGRYPKIYIEVNTGGEPQKAGILPEEADHFISYCQQDLKLQISGLMCIPPEDQQRSPHFALLASIARKHGISILSMGMSADFELAIQLGATHVRLGTALFGHRE